MTQLPSLANENLSGHQRFACELAELAHDRLIERLADESVGARRDELRGRRWRRTYGRFHPHADVYATLIYETIDVPQVLYRIDVSHGKGGAEEADVTMRDEVLGIVTAYRFPSDRTLRTLTDVCNKFPWATVVRYRPERRCTLRVEQDGFVRFAKVFGEEDGAQQHREANHLWDAAQRGELSFAVAQPGAWDGVLRCLWHECVAGRPVSEASFAEHGTLLAHRMGRALASLTTSSVRPRTVFGPEHQWLRTVKTAGDVVRRVPSLQPAIDQFLALIRSLHTTFAPRPLLPIHGSPHAKQWLDTGDRLALVDFEKLCLGDPELDVATFLAELDFEATDSMPIEAITEAFLAGYEAVAGPLDRVRLRAYRAHKQLVKALKAAQSVKPHGDAKAIRYVQRTLQGLA